MNQKPISEETDIFKLVHRMAGRFPVAEANYAKAIVCDPPTDPGDSSPVTRAGQIIGTLVCDSPTKWFGKAEGVSWNVRSTPEAAVQDIVDHANGRPIKYVKHCQGCVGKEVCGG